MTLPQRVSVSSFNSSIGFASKERNHIILYGVENT